MIVKKTTSPMWRYFKKGNAVNEAQCTICFKIVKTGGGTTNLRQHLRGQHKNHFLSLNLNGKEKTSTRSNPPPPVEKGENHTESEALIAAQTLAEENEFVIVEVDEFGNHNAALSPSVIPDNPAGRCQASRKRPATVPRMKKKQKEDNPLENAIGILKQIAVRPQSADEFTSFGQHIAVQLNCLPLEEALILQNDIQRLITAARLKSLRGRIRSSSPSTFSSDNSCTPQAESPPTETITTFVEKWNGGDDQ